MTCYYATVHACVQAECGCCWPDHSAHVAIGCVQAGRLIHGHGTGRTASINMASARPSAGGEGGASQPGSHLRTPTAQRRGVPSSSNRDVAADGAHAGAGASGAGLHEWGHHWGHQSRALRHSGLGCHSRKKELLEEEEEGDLSGGMINHGDNAEARSAPHTRPLGQVQVQNNIMTTMTTTTDA